MAVQSRVGEDAGKILIVDDEPLIRMLVARQLGQLGFPLVVTASAEEALARSQNERFRVVITDLQMSGMGGLALLQRLSPLQPQARFLVLTGRGRVADDLLPRGHRVRVFDKPWDKSELVAAVRGIDSGALSTLPPPASSRHRPQTRVLLIESNPTDPLAFCAYLDSQHPGEFGTTVAPDVVTGCALIEREPFDVIALDIALPDVSGLLRAVLRALSLAMVIGWPSTTSAPGTARSPV